MTPLAKKALLITLTILLVAIGTLLTAKHFMAPHIQPATIKKRLIEQIHSKTTWQANIPNALKIQWWPRPTLSTSNITLIDPRNPNQHYIKLPKVSLSIAVLPLLYGSVNINHITLTNPDIALNDAMLRTSKHPNAQASPTDTKASKQQQKAPDRLISPDHISINNGTLKYHKQGQTHQLTLSHLDMVEKGYHNYRIKMAANYQGPRLKLKTIKLDTHARWVIKQSLLTLKHFDFSSIVTINNLTRHTPIALSAKLFEYHKPHKTWNIQRGQLSLLNMRAKASLEKKRQGAHQPLDGTFEIKIADINQLLSDLGQKDNTAPSSKLKIAARFNTTLLNKQKNTYKATLGKDRIKIESTIHTSQAQQVSSNTVQANQLTPANWLNTKDAYDQLQAQLTKQKVLDIPTKATPAASPKQKSTTTIDIDKLYTGPLVLSQLKGSIRSQQGTTTTDGLTAKLYQGPFKLQFTWKSAPSIKKLTLAFKASEINIKKLIQSMKLKHDLSIESTASLSGTISMHGKTTDMMKQNTHGDIIFQLGKGHISSTKIQSMLSDLESKLLPMLSHKHITRAERKKHQGRGPIGFSSCIGHIKIQNGIANLNHINIKAPGFTTSTRGQYHTPNNRINTTIFIQVTKKFNAFLYMIQQNLSNNQLSILISGPIEKASVQPDYADMTAQLLQQKAKSKLLEVISKALSTTP